MIKASNEGGWLGRLAPMKGISIWCYRGTGKEYHFHVPHTY